MGACATCGQQAVFVFALSAFFNIVFNTLHHLQTPATTGFCVVCHLLAIFLVNS